MLLRKIREEGSNTIWNTLRLAGSAGDILPPAIVEQYKELLNIKLINFYGLTETMGHVTCEPLDGPSIQSQAQGRLSRDGKSKLQTKQAARSIPDNRER
jgi:acyl-coenzyme A synthetase/AMP-(fatty) acid ligase